MKQHILVDSNPFMIPRQVLLSQEISSTSKLLAGIINDMNTKAGLAEHNGFDPQTQILTLEQMAKVLGVTSRAISRSLSELRKSGFITSHPVYYEDGGRAPSRHRIVWHRE